MLRLYHIVYFILSVFLTTLCAFMYVYFQVLQLTVLQRFWKDQKLI